MLEAGAIVLETDSFQGSRLKLEEWGLADHTLEINRKAAEIARKAAGESRFVAGSIGPTGHLPASDDPTLGKITFRELVEVFTEQAQGLVEGGRDLSSSRRRRTSSRSRPRCSARARRSS
jgi:5-methyltetrahydrofolate--homocysteine methyltransferase